MARSELKTIVSCDEQGAGFAADAYARVRGMGAVRVTYGVGGLPQGAFEQLEAQ